MKQLNTPFRYDYVGSFLRPQVLKNARSAYEAGHISCEALRATEDQAILDLVKNKNPLAIM